VGELPFEYLNCHVPEKPQPSPYFILRSMMLNDLSYLRETAPGVNGLIGLDVLRQRSFTIDFGRRRITLGPSRTLRFSARMELDDAYLAVEVQILHRPARLLLDTGVSAIPLYRDRLEDRLPELRVEPLIRGARLGGAASLRGRHVAVRAVERHRLGKACSICETRQRDFCRA
jgi:hypothetical protein